ncbi:hypothetical protein J5N97_018473 [Dioscorea zingiberensis]|uniref:Uncharacterized protein n=1 Tax=Dioscorea zingiberensis TaxID=325984 RepID=A0A9D5CQL1_9LILI|nr:hypothetical protein J5N97_018473 [Dioscorea zingiberensis]
MRCMPASLSSKSHHILTAFGDSRHKMVDKVKNCITNIDLETKKEKEKVVIPLLVFDDEKTLVIRINCLSKGILISQGRLLKKMRNKRIAALAYQSLLKGQQQIRHTLLLFYQQRMTEMLLSVQDDISRNDHGDFLHFRSDEFCMEIKFIQGNLRGTIKCAYF